MEPMSDTDAIRQLLAENLSAANAKIERLREALGPFARASADIDEDRQDDEGTPWPDDLGVWEIDTLIKIGDLRRALAALDETQ